MITLDLETGAVVKRRVTLMKVIDFNQATCGRVSIHAINSRV